MAITIVMDLTISDAFFLPSTWEQMYGSIRFLYNTFHLAIIRVSSGCFSQLMLDSTGCKRFVPVVYILTCDLSLHWRIRKSVFIIVSSLISFRWTELIFLFFLVFGGFLVQVYLQNVVNSVNAHRIALLLSTPKRTSKLAYQLRLAIDVASRHYLRDMS